jgi:hypothetical protein
MKTTRSLILKRDRKQVPLDLVRDEKNNLGRKIYILLQSGANDTSAGILKHRRKILVK